VSGANDLRMFPQITCKECFCQARACYTKEVNQALLERELCFSCLFWTALVQKKESLESVRISGNHYTIGNGSKRLYRRLWCQCLLYPLPHWKGGDDRRPVAQWRDP
jgi:hypothetical protein